MRGADRRTVVALVGGGLVAVLLTTAAVLVSAEASPPPLEWLPDRVLADGQPVSDLGGWPSSAALQQLLVVHIDGVPQEVRTGETIDVWISLVNNSDTDVPLAPCPTYRLAFLEGEAAVDDATRPALSDVLGRFQCDESVVLEPGDSAATRMLLTLDPSDFPRPTTSGGIAIELWPTTEGMVPRTEVHGVTVVSDVLPEGFIPPGLDVEIGDPSEPGFQP